MCDYLKPDCIFISQKPTYYTCSALKTLVCRKSPCGFYKSIELYNKDGTKKQEAQKC